MDDGNLALVLDVYLSDSIHVKTNYQMTPIMRLAGELAEARLESCVWYPVDYIILAGIEHFHYRIGLRRSYHFADLENGNPFEIDTSSTDSVHCRSCSVGFQKLRLGC